MQRRTLCALLLVVLAAACSTPAPVARHAADAVVVASFDFTESDLVAEIYAQALEQAGVPVRREPRLGPRELVLPALRQGRVDVVPEYLGTAVATVTGAPAPAGVPARDVLARALRPDGLRVLRPAAAQDQNGLAVTRSTARRLGLRTTSDLRPHAARLVLGGPPECPQRAYCLVGLRRVYGLGFASFQPLARETERLTALEQGVVDVAVVFTTDGALAADGFVLLADDRSLQPEEQVVPVVTERAVQRYGDRVVRALDAVSARLDSAALVFLGWRLEVAHEDVPGEARGWLLRHGLVPR